MSRRSQQPEPAEPSLRAVHALPRGAVGLRLTAIAAALVGLAMLGGGLWLIALGGSAYYAVAGAATLATAVLLWRRRRSALLLYALVVPLPFKMGLPSLGGPVATAGGVAFLTSALDYYARAYDVGTGEQLWRARLPAGAQATPMTYRSAASGRQFALVVAGGHGSLGTRMGDHVIAYALPRRAG